MINNMFGFGCMRLPLLDKNDKTSFDYELIEEMFDEYLSRGYTYFDTAYVYHNYEGEKAVRKALVERHDRKAFEIATKLPLRDFTSKEDMEIIFNEQLENLGVTYFDYYLLHNMGSNVYKKCAELDAFEFVYHKKKVGKVKHVGMSFHDTPELLDEILTKYGEKIDFVQLQINYLDWNSSTVQSKKCLDVCLKHMKPVTVMEPCKGGTLVNVPKEVKDLFTSYKKDASVASWAFRFCLSQSGVSRVLSGMNSLEQLKDNLDTIDNFTHLNKEEYEIIDKAVEVLNKNIVVPCTGCSYCTKGCPINMPIPQYFALYNQKKALTGEFSSQFSYYNNLINASYPRAKECLGCGQCENACPQHINIRKFLKDVSDEFDIMAFASRPIAK